MRFGRALLFFLLSVALAAEPVAAQEVLRDAETESFLNDIAAPLGEAAGIPRGHLKMVLLGDKDINAFVAGGQMIYIHSGLFIAADNANELEGVIAHELGHIEGGHVPLASDNLKGVTGISLLSLLVGVAAMAAGAGGAGMAALSAGQAAAQGKYLAFSRAQEGSADASAVRHLNAAHLSGQGMISFFNKLKREEYRLTPSYTKIDTYDVDHPMTADREQVLRDSLQPSPWWNTPIDPAKQARFLRIKAKLIGYTEDPPVVMNLYPERDQSLAAHYARAYAWHRGAYPAKASEEVDKLVQIAPHDPYVLELKGQILLETGHPKEAIAPLREAVARSGDTPLISALLGHALVATEDPANLKEAQAVLKVAVDRDNDNPFAWYQLGTVYAKLGDEPRASLATAERYSLEQQPRLALASAEAALHGLPPGTRDYLRAQDIALTARTAAEEDRKHKR